MKSPLITIYIVTYNRINLLKRALESVIKQTYKNLEIIIVDDYSNDDTLKYLKEICSKDSRVKYFQNDKNSGACVSRNKAIKEARGDFITGLDDDDYFVETRIEDFWNIWNSKINNKSNIVCLFSNTFEKRTNDNMYIVKKSKIVLQKDLLIGNLIGNQIFTKTELLKKNLFDEKLLMWQDLDCWFRLLNKDKIALNTGSTTYVVDKSHLHERITTKTINNVYKTFDHFVNKYKFDIKEEALLKTHVFYYDKTNLNIKEIYHLFYKHLNFKALFILLKFMIKKLNGS